MYIRGLFSINIFISYSQFYIARDLHELFHFVISQSAMGSERCWNQRTWSAPRLPLLSHKANVLLCSYAINGFDLVLILYYLPKKVINVNCDNLLYKIIQQQSIFNGLIVITVINQYRFCHHSNNSFHGNQ